MKGEFAKPKGLATNQTGRLRQGRLGGGPGSTNRQLLTALTAAASGDVAGPAGDMLKAGAVSYLQQSAAEIVGVLAHGGVIEDGSPAHVALHAIIGCAGAAANGANCSAGALGASASVVITTLLNATAGPLDPNDPQAAANAEARRNVVANLVAGMAAAGGADATTAAAAALAEVDNNANKGLKPEEIPCGTLKVCLTGGTFKNADGTVRIESSFILRSLVPGQVAWDNARTNWANGEKGWAAGSLVAGILEQGLTIASLGTNRFTGAVTTSASTWLETATVTGAENPNAYAALKNKLSALEEAQKSASRVRALLDGRVIYYGVERAARTTGPSRGSSYVTEWNPQNGNVNRVHPKMTNGQTVNSPHYPPTSSEIGH